MIAVSTPYERKKEPERVRSALLGAAARLAGEHGLAAVTIEAVAKAAGVTKGGLFHHFPSKDALIRGAFIEMIGRFNEVIDKAMEDDPHPRGRFTRAYVEAVFNRHAQGHDTPLAALSLSMLADPSLQRDWAQWLTARLAVQGDDDNDVRFEVVRLAVDGVWLATLMTDADALSTFKAVRERLLELAAPIP